MSHRRSGIVRMIGAATLVLGALVGGAASPAAAESRRYVDVSPVAGSIDQGVDLLLPTGAFCPEAATQVIARLSGPGLPEPMNITGNTELAALNGMAVQGYSVLPLVWTWRDAGRNANPTPLALDGTYRITVSCLAGLDTTSLGDSIADVRIEAAAGTYRVLTPVSAGSKARQQESSNPSSADAEPDGDAQGEPSPGSGGSVPLTAGEEPSDQAGSDAQQQATVEPGQASQSPASVVPAEQQGVESGGVTAASAEVPGEMSNGLPSQLLIVLGIVALVVATYIAARSRGTTAERR